MTLKDLAGHSGFWDAVKYLEKQSGKTIDVDKISRESGVGHRDLYAMIDLMREFGCRFKILGKTRKVFKDSENNFPYLGAVETIQLILSHVIHVDSEQAKNFKEATDKVFQSPEYRYLCRFVEKLSDEFFGIRNNILSFHKTEETALTLERAIVHRNPIKILCKDQREFRLLPFKLMMLDGDMTLIGENIILGEACDISLSQISYVEEKTYTYKPLLTKIELEDYIHSLRSIKETEVRLILKVDSSVKWEESLPYQHFGNPCMIKKGKEHMIWAASVEPSEEIFEWINQMGNGVEIIDPSAFKRIYLRYCEDRLLRLG